MVSLNVDLGELPSEPDELYALATVVNVACGGHAGDAASIEKALRLAKASRARVAAHPSYPDREGFGRRARFVTGVELERALEEQLSLLRAIAEREGVAVVATKPHGALYHDAAHDPALAEIVVAASMKTLGSAAIVGPERGSLAEVARSHGLVSVREGFADRAYDEKGALVPRSRPGALITTPAACAAQAIRLARSGEIDTLCIHGDTEGAIEIARTVRRALEEAGLLESRP